MKRIFVFGAIMIFAVQMSQAQTAYTERRDVSGFSEIGFGVAGEVIISIGKDYSVVLEGEKDYIDEIETKVYGSELRIKREKRFDTGNKKVIVRITMPSLTRIGISGSGKVTVNDPLTGGDLDIGLSGSGKVFIRDVALGKVGCSISGSGSLNIAGSGSIENLEMHISGSGDYIGEGTRVAALGASISGSGSCNCVVTDMLRASISGSGNILYSGHPRIDVAVSGSGKVRMK